MNPSQYYATICKEPLLSASEEAALFKKYYEKGTTAKEKTQIRDKIIRANLRYAFKQAKYYSKDTPGMFEELISAGNEGLTVAFDKYSPAKKVRFLTYAGAWVDQRITHHMSRMRIVSLPTYKQQICAKIDKVKAANPEASNEELRELLKEQGFTEKQIKELFDYRYLTYYISDIDEQNFLVNPIEESFEKQLDDERVWKAVSQLPSPSREIIARMYGLVDGEEQTAAAIAKALRLTKEEITTHVENAMEILRDVFDA